MGAVYSIHLRIKVTDRTSAAEALRTKIARGDQEYTSYSLEHYQSLGVGTDSLEDLLKIFFGGWEAKLESSKGNKGFTKYDSAFDASYGWEGVMIRAFKEMAPYLEEESSIRIYPDSGVDYGRVKNGKVIWK